MPIRNVCVLGGAGFVGSSLCARLIGAGFSVHALTRDRERAKHLSVLPQVQLSEVDVHDESALKESIADADAVINLIGVLHDGRGNASFAAAHVALARKIVQACTVLSIRRLLHMSALNANPAGPSAYLRSKGEGEAIVLAASDALDVTVFRPSVIVGPRDTFLNRFAGLIRLFPVLPLARADARFQPVYVEDVTRILSASLADPRYFGKKLDVCGPNIYTLRELIEFTARQMGKRRWVVPLPRALGGLQARMMESLPGKLLTRDNLASMDIDSVCACDFADQFGFLPQALEAIAPALLANRTPRGRYNRFRHYAGR